MTGDEQRIDQFVFIIAKRLPVDGLDNATGLLDNAMRRGNIPLHGRSKSRINIGGALGDQT